MVKEKKSGLMVPSTKDNIKRVARTDEAASAGRMAATSKAGSSKTRWKAGAHMYGTTVVGIAVTGPETGCTVKAFSRGTTDASMSVVTSTTRRKVMEFSAGLTAALTKEAGKTESSMVRPSIPTKMGSSEKALGAMVNGRASGLNLLISQSLMRVLRKNPTSSTDLF